MNGIASRPLPKARGGPVRGAFVWCVAIGLALAGGPEARGQDSGGITYVPYDPDAHAASSPAGTDDGGPRAASLKALIEGPGSFGAPTASTPAGTRSLRAAVTQPPRVFVLAPATLAVSHSAQPTLYWHLSDASPSPIRLTVQDLEAARPVAEIDLGQPSEPGIHATSLARQGVRLDQDRVYTWSVALQVDPEAFSAEPVAATLLTVRPDPGLLARIEAATPIEQARALAAAGYWYDALDVVSGQIASGDRSEPWRELRASLLEQVGLATVADFDRAQGD